MFARISFENNQRISKAELQKLSETLADEIKYDKLVIDKDNKESRFYSYQDSLDPNDDDVISGKKKLVKESGNIELDSGKEYICDMETFIGLHPNIKIKLRGLPKAIGSEGEKINLIQQMNYINDKFENTLKKFNESVEFNQKCDVHVSNLGLLHINETGYAVDYCTEALQDLLNQGWRIIASCVQPDQRRPDYILGRYNPDFKDGKMECKNFN